jgi:hypothetical protein
MDTATRTLANRIAVIRAPRPLGYRAWIALASVAVLVFLAARTGAHAIAGASILVLDASPEQERIVTWAIGRYGRAGLELPRIVLQFHDDPRGCGNNSGYTLGDRIDICTTGTRAYVRATLLHEMAHVWLEKYASEELRMGFLRLRGLNTWDSPEAPWGLRGVEQAAETIAWGLGEGTIEPLIPDDGPDGLTLAFEFLTGGRPPSQPIASWDPGAFCALPAVRPLRHIDPTKSA